MSRKKKHAEHVNHERWLVSYADFITLLFAFFVVMFSSSQVDSRKVGALAVAIQVAFQELGVFPASNTQMPLSTTHPLPFSEVQLVENADQSAAQGKVVSPAHGTLRAASLSWDVDGLQRELLESLATEIERHEVTVVSNGETLVLSLREIGFFDSGVAKVRPESQLPLARIAQALATRPHHLRIEGHTDNVPIHTAIFDSNWELSTARATELTKLFITQYKISPERLSAAGFAEFHPVASNQTPEGRAANRRVDVIILAPPGPPALPAVPNSEPGNLHPPVEDHAGKFFPDSPNELARFSRTGERPRP